MSCNKKSEVKQTIFSEKCIAHIEVFKSQLDKDIVCELTKGIQWEVAHGIFEYSQKVPDCKDTWLVEMYTETDPVYHVRYIFTESATRRLIIGVKIEAVA